MKPDRPRRSVVAGEFDERAGGDRTEDVLQALLDRLCARKYPNRAAVVDERERDLGIAECQRREKRRDPRKLGGRRTQIVAAHGDVFKKRLDGDARTERRRRRLRFRYGSIEGVDGVADFTSSGARDQANACNGRDARQALAAKPERRDAFQVGGPSELARRMARERQTEFLARDPRAIVEYFDRVESAARDRDGDPPRARVERVFDQFLNDRKRPFDDLARGDLPDRRFVEKPDHEGKLDIRV